MQGRTAESGEDAPHGRGQAPCCQCVERAAEEYGKSLEADPKQEKVWETKAYCHQQADDTEGAVATLMKWAETKPDAVEKAKLIRFGADLWKQKGNQEKSEAAYLDAIKVLPTDDESYSWLADMYAIRGGARDVKAAAVPANLDKAYAYYGKVGELKPDSPNAFVMQRVIMTKYVAYYQKQKEDAEAEAKVFEKDKDKDKAAEATARAEKAKTEMEAAQKKIEEATAKMTEANKKAAAAASAAAAAPPAASAATKK
jgi:tetratricopeptide (TPR) repeat protein